MSTGTRRWVAFNLVGLLGLGVQLATLAGLREAVGLGLPLATGLAVEAAILHNFWWHARWTWRDRDHGAAGHWRRLARFNLASGALAITGNIVCTSVLVRAFGVHYAIASVIAVASCSVTGYLVTEHLVFRKETLPASSRAR